MNGKPLVRSSVASLHGARYVLPLLPLRDLLITHPAGAGAPGGAGRMSQLRQHTRVMHAMRKIFLGVVSEKVFQKQCPLSPGPLPLAVARRVANGPGPR